ncbi:formylglycine-generating enzyme family protein [Nitrospina gracilis]|uniref:formylglycine-generating enzyme family protein n=1 Tax=Nitrospina gracilis TaxID=35801 RepID=UPI001F46699E|nr:formylglycine-generating enzyme family protein [Nitrospina gracilis]MCF8721685.1 formylglycine-generating enzyme required for sulfatase activity [Nitrospina gracilis Nb-211]
MRYGLWKRALVAVCCVAAAWTAFGPGLARANEQPQPPEGMVFIPPGTYTMGLEGASNKYPHKVFVDGFFLDKFEVTQKDYVAIRGANPSKFEGENRPADQVTWLEASAYCKQVGKRLPTEAEWEKAARAGTQTAYFWGDEHSGEYAWYEGNSDETTHPVGQKKPNAYGLHDMSGNVWEWVSDWYDKTYYERSPPANPQGPETGTEKTLRGGSWYSGARHQMSATRFWSEPHIRNSNFGFRCAMDAPKTP